jgi:radical SAM superfamily enzyme YgiQ (UPF0313 family)
MKVLLISANQVREPYPVYPLGLDYVAGALAADHHVDVLDLNQLPAGMDLEGAIGALGPDIVGVSLRNIDNTDVADPKGFVPHYQAVIRTVRRACGAPIVLGGSGFTIFPERLMALLEADYGIVGEGERLRMLLQALEQGADPFAIPGVIGRGAIPAAPVPWPHAVTRKFEPGAGHVAFYLKNGGMLNLQTKRGCPFKCVYCTYPRIEGRNMRCEPPDEIARAALSLEHVGAKYIFLTDSAFNADIQHSLAVARALRAIGVSIPWGGFFAPVASPPDYFKVLADCGLRHVEFGTESFCDKVLTAYGKPFKTQQVHQAHQAAVAAGLHVAHYFLFGGPGESEQTLHETLDNIDRLEKTVLFLFCGMRIYPHTALYDLAVRQGQIATAQCIVEPVYYQPEGMDLPRVMQNVQERARGRDNWVLGAGGEKVVRIMARMYRRGFSGPLWEYLIR